MTYKNFNDYNIDLSPLGVMGNEDSFMYFCTPTGARVIGWTGVDGIHYCFVRGFSETVFAVSPMNTPGEYVHPVAKDFKAFLRLLLACGDSAAVEQAWMWNEQEFNAFLSDNPPTDEQRAVMDILREKLHLTPMENPYAYLQEIQREFDYSSIPYTEDYDDSIPIEPELPPWKVYFEGDFWDPRGKGRPGIEIPLQCRFDWDGQEVYVPAAYSCAKGLVMDICIKIPAEEICRYMEKWKLLPENDESGFTYEEQMQAAAENPFNISFRPEVTMNGKALHCSRGNSLSWNPCALEGDDIQVRGVLQHYNMDSAHGWSISRYTFPWTTVRRPQVHTLSLTLFAYTVAFPGPMFQTFTAGERVDFTHPKTNVHHTLVVQEYEQQQMPEGSFGDDAFEYPSHFTVMSYNLSPDLPRDAFSLIDCEQGDRPIPLKKEQDFYAPESTCSVGVIIGGDDGPTTILLPELGQSKLRTACSTLHFGPEYDVKWQMIFHEKVNTDITADLL